MPYNSTIHHRRSIRLKGYDYSQAGAYFVTICTYQRECLFGEIVQGVMRLNGYGEMVQEKWSKTPGLRAGVELGEFVVMPNHFHGIILITSSEENDPHGSIEVGSVGAYGHTPLPEIPISPGLLRSPSKTIGAMVRGFKAAVTGAINTQRGTPGVPVWQRNYWEHIIRDEKSDNTIGEYIFSNPARWEMDELFSVPPGRG